MAVFLLNTCKFKGCGITFPTLTELIRHIEDTHLDFDAQAAEQQEVQQPTCLPISYVLRVFEGGEYRHTHPNILQRKEPTNVLTNAIKTKFSRSFSPAPSITSTTPTGSEMEEDPYESESEESSIDSWSNVSTEGDSSHAILKMLSTNSTSLSPDGTDKPYVCHINGCKKRYRNANGLKYHAKSVHDSSIKKDGLEASKLYKCHCGKIYKTPHGLKNHVATQHSTNRTIAATTTVPYQRASYANIKSGKDSVLATFVRMKSLPPNVNATNISTTTVATTVTTTATNTSSTVNPIKVSVLPAQTNCELVMIKQEPDSMEEGNENSIKIESANGGNNNKYCPVIKAPTLQQHLLSPIVTKASSRC